MLFIIPPRAVTVSQKPQLKNLFPFLRLIAVLLSLLSAEFSAVDRVALVSRSIGTRLIQDFGFATVLAASFVYFVVKLYP